MTAAALLWVVVVLLGLQLQVVVVRAQAQPLRAQALRAQLPVSSQHDRHLMMMMTNITKKNSMIDLQCDPCIERPNYVIRAIVHGVESSLFWRQVRAAAFQAASDLRVQLIMELYQEFDPEQMAQDIVKATTAAAQSSSDDPDSNNSRLDALIVTLPSQSVQDAVAIALESGVPVFGLNSGYDVADGLLGFVAMDEYRGGQEAAKHFLQQLLLLHDNDNNNSNNTTTRRLRALFVNTQQGNRALDQRYQGFRDTLQAAAAAENNNNNILIMDVVEQLVVDKNTARIRLQETMKECPYDIVLLASGSILEDATLAFSSNGCALSNNHLLATFDTSSTTYDAIAVGKLSFAVSQQQHLQGSLAVVMAAVYATTGKKLALSSASEFGIYFSGPLVIDLKNLPSDSLQRCEVEAFPVCRQTTTTTTTTAAAQQEAQQQQQQLPLLTAVDDSTTTSKNSKCDCTDRTQIRLGGVLHGATTDRFWDIVFRQAQQAADDMNVQLVLNRLEPEATIDVLRAKMASKIKSLCQDGVDGLFVTLPSADVIDAVATCQKLSIPVISLNTAPSVFEAADLTALGVVHHIAQVEYSAGYGAGQRLVAAGMTAGVCLVHVENHPGLQERCRGFQAGISSSSNRQNITNLGVIHVPFDNKAGFVKIVEDFMTDNNNIINNNDDDDDWEGIGALLAGQILVEDGLSLQTRHPRMLLGSFDTSEEIYKNLNSGRILFGIDQEPFLQGYLPVPLLTWLVYTKQALVNTFIETGPRFVEAPPTAVQQTCEVSLYEVCPEPVKNNLNQLTKVRPMGLTLCGIILATSISFIAWIIWNREANVVRASQPVFLVMICLGTLVMGSAIIPLSMDDSATSAESAGRACMAVPWLLTTGFIIVFAALFSKIWRINKLVDGAKSFRRLTVETKDVMLPFCILLSLNVIFLLVWTLVDPMYWNRRVICGSGDLSSYGVCELGHTGVSIAMLSCLLALILGALILANIQAYKARNFSTEFSESKYIGIAMIGLLQISFVGVPLIALVNTNPTASFFIRSALLFVICMSILLLIFVPKVMFLKHYTRDKKKRQEENSQVEQGVQSPGGFLGPNSLRSRQRRPTSSSHPVSGLVAPGVEERNDGGPSVVPMRNILQLERLLKDQGIDSDPLFREAGIGGAEDQRENGDCSQNSQKSAKESIVSFAES